MLMLSHTAFGANLFDPTSGDVSIKVLGAIFGGLLDSGGTADPLLNGIKAFNAGVLLIGGILAAYTIFSATVNTAHEGEVMGKSYSSAWLPIRYAIGTSIVLPIIGGGYCVMQAIVMWLVVQGIGLADNVWGAFMSNPTSTANTKIWQCPKDS
ncbi:DotA/TraY family protein [Burkholderia cenocepacia]|uniref:DotA/TraY family protein n=1 Tax=Burkholderia cenocepacia TaxID=95486 RepID=UPI001B9BCDBD|nr:DotA/TraY family protein [Burkholderia cenocepacia]MBR7905814.1 DotA/TraY family protein [Burkholderia cenocepacia]